MTDLPAMGWSCWSCSAPFEHGRLLVDHLIAEHPEEVEHLCAPPPLSPS